MTHTRPKALSPELKDEILERIIDCTTISSIARDPHMPDARTIYRALAQDETFRRQYEAAKVIQLYCLEEELLDLAGGHECDPEALERLLYVTQRLIARRTPKTFKGPLKEMAERYLVFDPRSE